MIVSPAPYLPFNDPHKGRPPGLWPLDPAAWTEVDDRFADQMAYRDRLIAERPDLVALAEACAAPAIAELFALLVDHLAGLPGYARAAGRLERPDGVAVPDTPGIAALGRLCQEDWLILQTGGPGGEYLLTAGNLCFPAGWNLPDKIGRPLTAVHDPVPDYAAELAPRVNRIFAAIHPDRPLQRLNWSIAKTAELHCPVPRGQHLAAEGHFLRVERQTLRRLPQTGAVVFGIKTYVTPEADLDPADRATMWARAHALSPAMKVYKRIANP